METETNVNITPEQTEKMLEVIEKEGDDEPEFNNGFITAIALFVQHKNQISHLMRDDKGKVKSDMRLYAAADHLYEMEIPKNSSINISRNLRIKIIKWRDDVFHHRMDFFEDTIITDRLFKEGEDILASIDEEIFKTKQVKMHYR
jgi:hypothetical protein